MNWKCFPNFHFYFLILIKKDEYFYRLEKRFTVCFVFFLLFNDQKEKKHLLTFFRTAVTLTSDRQVARKRNEWIKDNDIERHRGISWKEIEKLIFKGIYFFLDYHILTETLINVNRIRKSWQIFISTWYKLISIGETKDTCTYV